jgi:hypothetical protein
LIEVVEDIIYGLEPYREPDVIRVTPVVSCSAVSVIFFILTVE